MTPTDTNKPWTAGPWHYDPRAVQNIWAPGRGWIAAVGSSGMFGANAGVKADEANARLISAAPEMAEALAAAIEALAWARPLAVAAMEDHRVARVKAGHTDMAGTYRSGTTYVGIHQDEVDQIEAALDALQQARAALQKARGGES